MAFDLSISRDLARALRAISRTQPSPSSTRSDSLATLRQEAMEFSAQIQGALRAFQSVREDQPSRPLSWQESLETWVLAKPEERDAREQAAQRIRDCYASGSSMLDLIGCPITDLTGIQLPGSLRLLYLCDCPIASLVGVQLPGSLQGLYLRHCPMASLAGVQLPGSLEHFWLDYSSITSLEGVQLPSSLRHFSLCGCRITSLAGVQLPSGLATLDLTDCPITSLAGVQLPSSLRQFSLRGCRITSLAGVQFSSSLRLCLYRCPITSFHGVSFYSGVVQDIPEAVLIARGATILQRDASNQQTYDLSSEFQQLGCDPSTHTNLLEHRDASQLANFLSRMRSSWPAYNHVLKDYLSFAQEDEHFREVLFSEIQTSNTNCHDRPLYLFSRLSVIASFYQAQKANNPHKMLQALLAMHSIALIEEAARGIHDREALEVALFLQLELKGEHHLALPIAINSMGNAEYAQWLILQTSVTVDGIKKRCLDMQKTREQKIEIVLNSPYFQKQYASQFKQLQDEYTDAIEYIRSPDDQVSDEAKAIALRVIRDTQGRAELLNDQQKQEAMHKLTVELGKEKQNLLRSEAGKFVDAAMAPMPAATS